jgi:Cof subfamily protein (haloacid dehalogenase superfamily)
MNKVLATDLDGTLFYPKQVKRCIPKSNLNFIRKWIDAGNKLVLVTSRSEEFIKRVVDEIQRPVDLILCNSSKIIANGEVIRDVTIPKQEIQTVLGQISKKYAPLGYLMTTKNCPLVIRNNRFTGKLLMSFYKLWWLLQFKYRETYELSNKLFDEELLNGDVYKVIVFFGLSLGKKKFAKELNKVFYSEFPDIEFSWIRQVIELTPKECSKGKGLTYYCNHLGIDANDVYVIGDSGNDISMFKAFKENSFCMKHASKVAKKYAKHVVKRVSSLENYLLKGENLNESN